MQDGPMDGGTNRRRELNGPTNGQTDGQMDGHTNRIDRVVEETGRTK